MNPASNPLISVALCTYNGERFLREQLDSLLAQDYAPLEIIAVDDASTDGTMAILEEYRRRDGRLQVHRNPANIGFRRNFEKVIGLCRGELIATCDQDDIWHPGKLSTLVSAMGDAILVYGDSELMANDGRTLGLKASDAVNMYDGCDPRVFIFYNCISGHAMLFQARLFPDAQPFPQSGYHDWWLAFVAASIGRVKYVDECLVRYRQHETSQTSMAGRLAGRRRSRKTSADSSDLTVWLEAVQSYERCPEHALLTELYAAWRQRPRRYVVPRLFRLVFANRHSFFHVRKGGALQRVLRSVRFLWGLKARRLFRPGRPVESLPHPP